MATNVVKIDTPRRMRRATMGNSLDQLRAIVGRPC
jgi:hypothetical protein